MNTPNPDEQDVQEMNRLAAGHDAALNELMERHGERLFHYLVRSLQNEDDAADLAQETFVKVYQSRTRFDPSQKFSTWLCALCSRHGPQSQVPRPIQTDRFVSLFRMRQVERPISWHA